MFKKGLREKMEVGMMNACMSSRRMMAIKYGYGIRVVPTIVANRKKKIVSVPREKDLRKLIEKEMER